ncbi:MAG TPA: OmpA family protein [Chryseolinea sp.]
MKGIKKIKWAQGGKVYPKLSTPNKLLTIAADEFVFFDIAEWYPGTMEPEKKQEIIWMWQTGNKRIIHWKKSIPAHLKYGIRLPKPLCGAETYYLEARLPGQSDGNDTGLTIRGHCTPKITSSKWTKTYGGDNITNKSKSNTLGYGASAFLHLETEGLNGCKLEVEVYHHPSDRLIKTYPVFVEGGEINLEIRDTLAWYTALGTPEEVEEFYILLKSLTGKYIAGPDAVWGAAISAQGTYLNLKNKIVHSLCEPPKNLAPLKIGKEDPNHQRWEPCKFETIDITDMEGKNGTEVKKRVFDNGKNLTLVKYAPQKIASTVFFDFDHAIVGADGRDRLNNILNFILGHPYSTISIESYACSIGKQEYNQDLSQKRGDAVKKIFTDGRLDPRRLNISACGERHPTDDKDGGDNIKHKDEKDYVESRRADISFDYEGHDANTLIHETIAPSQDKTVKIQLTKFQTTDCILEENDKHEKKIVVLSPEYTDPLETTGVDTIEVPVHSALSYWNVAPIKYIWPAATTPTAYYIHVHTCRYYSDEQKAAVLIRAYPDIKWTLKFFLNLTNDLAVRWVNQPAHKVKELEKKAEKIAAEKRWQQKEASFGFSLKAEWDKSKDVYNRQKELKAEYEGKFKKIYDAFSSFGSFAEGIKDKTGGAIKTIGSKKIPVVFEIKPPNISIDGVWFLEKVKETDVEKLGTAVTIALKAEPLIGLKMTIDLLGFAIGVGVGAFTGGAGAAAADRLYQTIKEKMKKGIKFGNEEFGAKASADIYIDLIFSGEIGIHGNTTFNTACDKKPFQAAIDGTLKAEIKAGAWAKGEVVMLIVKGEASFEVEITGSTSITMGYTIASEPDGVVGHPKLFFNGLKVQYIVKSVTNFSTYKPKVKEHSPSAKEHNIKRQVSTKDSTVIVQDSQTLLDPFDLIKALEEFAGTNTKAYFIKY